MAARLVLRKHGIRMGLALGGIGGGDGIDDGLGLFVANLCAVSAAPGQVTSDN